MFYTREIKKEEINYLVDIARLQQEVCFIDINTFYTDEELLKSYYIEEVLKGNDLVWGAFLDDKLIGGCFFYAYKNSLYIESLFVAPQYQKSVWHVGMNLVNDILANKERVQEYFQRQISSCSLFCVDANVMGFYEKLGFQPYEGSCLSLVKKL